MLWRRLKKSVVAVFTTGSQDVEGGCSSDIDVLMRKTTTSNIRACVLMRLFVDTTLSDLESFRGPLDVNTMTCWSSTFDDTRAAPNWGDILRRATAGRCDGFQ